MKFLLGLPLFEPPLELLAKVKACSHGIPSKILDRIDPLSFDNKSYCYAIGDVRIFEVPISQSQTIYQVVSKVTGALAFANVQHLFKPGVNSSSISELLKSVDGLPIHPLLSQELTRVFGPNLENLPDNTRMISSITDFSVVRHYEEEAGALLDLLVTALNELHMNTVFSFAPDEPDRDLFHPMAYTPPHDLPPEWPAIRVEIFDTVQMANMFRINECFSSMQTMIQLGNTFYFNMPFFSHFTGKRL